MYRDLRPDDYADRVDTPLVKQRAEEVAETEQQVEYMMNQFRALEAMPDPDERHELMNRILLNLKESMAKSFGEILKVNEVEAILGQEKFA